MEDEIKIIEDKINKLKIIYEPINYWEGIKYKPYIKRCIDLDEVLEIINNLKYEK